MAHLTIIRGLPGSGKTTFGKRIVLHPHHCVSADDYMVDEQGNYRFDRNKLGDAHDWCYHQVVMLLEAGIDCAVANTFSRICEMERYIRYCKAHQHAFTVIVMDQQFNSVHNVPVEAIQRYADRWEWWGIQK